MPIRTLLLASVALAAGCGEKNDPIDTHVCDGLSVGDITYDSADEAHNVAPIFEKYCTVCPAEGGGDRHGAPTSSNVDSFEGAEKLAAEISDNVVAAIMPPRDDIDSGFVDRPTKEERCKVKTWVDQGAIR